MNLATLDPEAARVLSDMWLPHLEAVRRKGANIDGTADRILCGWEQVHLVWNGAAHVASVGTRQRVLRGIRYQDVHWCGGGDLPVILGIVPELEAHGRSLGCQRMTITGRRGWARHQHGNGYRAKQIVLERTL
jgi:hypothetical protein